MEHGGKSGSSLRSTPVTFASRIQSPLKFPPDKANNVKKPGISASVPLRRKTLSTPTELSKPKASKEKVENLRPRVSSLSQSRTQVSNGKGQSGLSSFGVKKVMSVEEVAENENVSNGAERSIGKLLNNTDDKTVMQVYDSMLKANHDGAKFNGKDGFDRFGDRNNNNTPDLIRHIIEQGQHQKETSAQLDYTQHIQVRIKGERHTKNLIKYYACECVNAGYIQR